MSTYQPVFAGSEVSVENRWRAIRAFLEAFYQVQIPPENLGAARAIELRERVRLPESVRSFIGLTAAMNAATITTPNGRAFGLFGAALRDDLTLEMEPGRTRLHLITQAEGDVRWTVEVANFDRDDPPVSCYHLDSQDPGPTRWALDGAPIASTSGFIVLHLVTYLDFSTSRMFFRRLERGSVEEETLRQQLPSHSRWADIDVDIYEGENMIGFLAPEQDDPQRRLLTLRVPDRSRTDEMPEPVKALFEP